MATTIGSLQIVFGLVAIPVRVQATVATHDVALHQVHAVDEGHIRLTRTCSTCSREVPYADVARDHIVGGRTAVLGGPGGSAAAEHQVHRRARVRRRRQRR